MGLRLLWSRPALHQHVRPLPTAPASHAHVAELSLPGDRTALLEHHILEEVSDPWTNVATWGGLYGDGSLLYPGKKVGLTALCPRFDLRWSATVWRTTSICGS